MNYVIHFYWQWCNRSNCYTKINKFHVNDVKKSLTKYVAKESPDRPAHKPILIQAFVARFQNIFDMILLNLHVVNMSMLLRVPLLKQEYAGVYIIRKAVCLREFLFW